MADGLRAISIVSELPEYDPESFVSGLGLALEDNPKNLTAARALIWFLIRHERFDEAQKVYDGIQQHWKNYNEIFLEQIRMLLVQGLFSEAQALFKSSRRFFRGAGLSSYGVQCLNNDDGPDGKAYKEDLFRYGAVVLRSLLSSKTLQDSGLMKPAENEALWALSKRVLEAKSIALVGNAPTLKGQAKGEDIDAHDLVIRCNFPQLKGYGADVGNRTDIVMFNESLRGRLGRLRNESEDFRNVLSIGLHPEPRFGLPTEAYFAEMANIGTIPEVARNFISDICYSRSTTGLMAINLLVFIFNKKISIYGFDFFNDVKQPHYFGGQVGAYLGHELHYEKWYAKDFLGTVFKEHLLFS